LLTYKKAPLISAGGGVVKYNSHKSRESLKLDIALCSPENKTMNRQRALLNTVLIGTMHQAILVLPALMYTYRYSLSKASFHGIFT